MAKYKERPQKEIDKDLDRLESLKMKSKGDKWKAEQYAEAMAKAITDPEKAFGRYLAAVEVFDRRHIATVPFLKKASQLGIEEADEIIEKNRIEDLENKSIDVMKRLGTYKPDLPFDDNIKLCVRQDASWWDKLPYIPDHIKNDKANIQHKMATKLKLWNDFSS